MSKFKQFIVGVLVGSFLFGISPTFAETLKYIKVKINGEYLSKNAILIDGTTYVPLRVISEKFNKKVGYNTTTNEVEVEDSYSNVDNSTIQYESKPEPIPVYKSHSTNLPQGATFTEWKYGIKYNNELYIFSGILEDKLYFKLTSDENNMYFKHKDYGEVTISYEEAKDPKNKIKKNDVSNYFNVKYFKGLIPKEYTQE